MACEGVIGRENIPFGIVKQSGFGFCPTNGQPQYPYMDIVRSNIAHLKALRGIKTDLELGIKSGAGQSWVSRYMAGKIAKSNPDKLALIARYLGVSASQLMWSDLTAPGAVAPSHPTQLERETMAAAVKLVQELEALSPVPQDPSTFSDRLAIAGKAVDRFGHAGIIDGTKLNDALRHFAAELRKAG